MNINKLHFSIDIKAEPSKVWQALWSDSGYRDWIGVLAEGAYAVTEAWKEGSIVHFLGPDQSGIYSNIEQHVPNEIMQFRHIGAVVQGEEQPLDEETRKWTRTTEAYTLTQIEGGVRLQIDIDVMEEHLEFMQSTFPIALERIKNNCC